ncbi:MAG TPA: hypothetical protein VKU02_16360 [Gemmataceae bacterium]|nr:hypothetical protein [Gemmataceae bacterium]
MRISVKCIAPIILAGWTGLLSAQQPFVPQGIDSVGLQRIVPDTICFFNDWNYDGVRDAQLDNWEPYTSVLGNSVFLIENNTYALTDPTNPSQMQRYGVVFQAVEGGAPVQGEAFFADDGTPYQGIINNYRQNGNPGRVAGDKRPGAINFIAGGEACPDEFSVFRSDSRWDTGVVRGGRYASVQNYSLDPTTLTQTPTSKAYDAILGRLKGGVASAGGTEIGRFGGDMVGLSNGNFLVVVDDESNLIAPVRSATAVIVAADGSIVKDSFVIGPGTIWSNVAAFKGGFCVRLNGILMFYDNSGTLQGEASQSDAAFVDNQGNVFSFSGDRGDGTRIASHINSNYVSLAGAGGSPLSQVRVAVWDARDQSFQGSINVNELSAANGGTDPVDFLPTFDRANLAVDALNRVLVTYEVQQAPAAEQVAARVLAFDPTSATFSYLTQSFLPFINNDFLGLANGPPIKSYRVSPSMTTKELLIAAKGLPNSLNMPDQGSDVPGDTNFYTVITHPNPQDDPTGGP